MIQLRRFSKYDVIMFIGFILYTCIWSFISLMRFYSLQADVFDLGYKMELGWYSLYNPHFGLVTDASHMIVYFFFPLFLFKNYPLLLIFQSFFIGLAAIPIYMVTYIQTHNKKLALFLGFIYLLFPLNIGLNWYDFHFMMFFPTLFVFAFLFFLKEKYRLSFFFFILSALTTYPFAGFSILFGISFLIEELLRRKALGNNFSFDKRMKFLILLILISVSIFAIQFYLLGINANMLSKNQSTSVTILTGIQEKIVSILFILVIGGYAAIVRPKWVIFLIPYFFLVFYSTNYVFEYPRIIQFQYGPLVTPFIFLALSDMLSPQQSNKKVNDHIGKTKKVILFTKVNHKNVKVASIIFLLFLVIGSSMSFNPLSPLNKDSQVNFNFYEKDIPNFVIYNGLEKLISLVPPNNPYLMVQQNIPEAYPRPFYQNVGILSVGGGGIAYNSSNNNFYVYNTVKGWQLANIQYVLYDPLSQWAQICGNSIAAVSPQHNSSYQNMYNMIFELLASGKYGILGEANGMVLLEKGYFGELKYYEPLYDIFQISDNNITNEIPGIWHGSKYTFVSPGNYDVKLKYYAVGNYSGNVTFSVTGNVGEVPILNVTRYVSYSSYTYLTLNFNFTEKFPYMYVGFTFPNNLKYSHLISLEMYQVGALSNTVYGD